MPPAPHAAGEAPPLDIRGVIAGYGGVDADGFPRTRILDGIDLTIAKGRVLGVIGESGCGKSTLARVVAGLHPQAQGSVNLAGVPLPRAIRDRSRDQLRRVQMVFQMADTALNPAMSVGRALARPLTFYHGLRGKPLKAETARLLDLVKLPAALADRLPGELSGGQKQRVNLARALAARPDLILCDEVTSALDPVVAEAVLDLLIELRRELGLALMFITHDLQTVRAIADDVLVLYGGQTVEMASRASLSSAPRHPYARLLMASVPELRQGWLEDVGGLFDGRFARPAGAAAGCRFFPRCGLGLLGTCDIAAPPVRRFDGREIHCHREIDDLIAATRS